MLTSAALDSEDWGIPRFERLRAELTLAGHVAEEAQRGAEAVGQYRRLVSRVLAELREARGGSTGRSVDWALTSEQRRVGAISGRNGACPKFVLRGLAVL